MWLGKGLWEEGEEGVLGGRNYSTRCRLSSGYRYGKPEPELVSACLTTKYRGELRFTRGCTTHVSVETFLPPFFLP